MKQHPIFKTILIILLAGAMLACNRPAGTPASEETAAPVETPAPVEETEIVAEVVATPVVTEVPLPTLPPTPSPTPEPTPPPEPTPTPPPEPEPITFIESADMPMPDPNGPIMKGHPFRIDGTVRSIAPLTRVYACVKNSGGKVVLESEQTFEESKNVTECRLLDLTFSKDVGCISENLRFEKLSAGSFTLEIFAEDAAGHSADLVRADFTVTSDKKVQLLPNNLRGNYTTALAFFGSPEKFMFRYSFKSGEKRISVDGDWLKKYDARATVINGKKWGCHVDAVPYFEQAGRYMENTYIRIHGGRLDTGAVRLADLVEMNGTTVRRFVNSGDFVSHHSFGTAVDINAYTPSHRDILANRDKIYREVTDNLTYNGIIEYQGRRVYDFTYTGSAKSGRKNVPEPLMNYLLYELAFFRAGFSWGLYYPHTCDGMHFSLTELSPTLFEEGPYAMRKVFSYIEDEQATPEASDTPEATPEPTPEA